MSTLLRWPPPAHTTRQRASGPQVITIAVVPPSGTPPTFPDEQHLAEGTGTRAFTAVTTSAGDFLVVAIVSEQNTAGETFPPSGGGLTYTVRVDNGTGGGDCRVLIYTALDAAGGSRTVTITPSSGTRLYTAHVTVVHGSEGPSGTGSSLTAQSVGATRTADSSAMFMCVGDFSAGAVGSPSWTPGGSTVASQQGSGATYLYGRYDNAGSAGTETHGIASPSYSTPTVAVLEMLGTSAGAPLTVTRTDDAGLTDATAAAVELVRTDSAGLTDATLLERGLVVSDSAGLTDAAIAGLVTVTTVTDSAGLTDTAGLGQQPVYTDQVGLTDAAGLTRAPDVTDQAGLTDAAVLAQTHVLTDSAGLTDTSTQALLKSAGATDSAGLTDALAFAQTHVLTDQAGLTDTPGLTQAKDVTDQAGLTDATVQELGKAVTVDDPAGLTDATLHSQTHVLTEQAGLTDAATAAAEHPLTVTDQAGLSDSVAAVRVLLQVPTDQVGLTDAIELIAPEPSIATQATSTVTVTARRTSTPAVTARRTSTSGVTAERTSAPTVSGGV